MQLPDLVMFVMFPNVLPLYFEQTNTEMFLLIENVLSLTALIP